MVESTRRTGAQRKALLPAHQVGSCCPGAYRPRSRLLGCSCVLSPGSHLRLVPCRPQGLCAAKKSSGNKGAECTQRVPGDAAEFSGIVRIPASLRWARCTQVEPPSFFLTCGPTTATAADRPAIVTRIECLLRRAWGLRLWGLLSRDLWG